jgi:hypothetical protein
MMRKYREHKPEMDSINEKQTHKIEGGEQRTLHRYRQKGKCGKRNRNLPYKANCTCLKMPPR